MTYLQRRIGAWWASRGRPDDSGAVSTETAIITALLGIGAVGLVTFIGERIDLWEAQIPTP